MALSGAVRLIVRQLIFDNHVTFVQQGNGPAFKVNVFHFNSAKEL